MWKEGSVSAWLPPACAPRMGAALTAPFSYFPHLEEHKIQWTKFLFSSYMALTSA